MKPEEASLLTDAIGQSMSMDDSMSLTDGLEIAKSWIKLICKAPDWISGPKGAGSLNKAKNFLPGPKSTRPIDKVDSMGDAFLFTFEEGLKNIELPCFGCKSNGKMP
jgi:hypothetical protein